MQAALKLIFLLLIHTSHTRYISSFAAIAEMQASAFRPERYDTAADRALVLIIRVSRKPALLGRRDVDVRLMNLFTRASGAAIDTRTKS